MLISGCRETDPGQGNEQPPIRIDSALSSLEVPVISADESKLVLGDPQHRMVLHHQSAAAIIDKAIELFNQTNE